MPQFVECGGTGPESISYLSSWGGRSLIISTKLSTVWYIKKWQEKERWDEGLVGEGQRETTDAASFHNNEIEDIITTARIIAILQN